jgi:hypothetical protein
LRLYLSPMLGRLHFNEGWTVRVLAAMQGVLACGALAVTALAPPAEGVMLVLPVASGPLAPTLNWITANGGRIAGLAVGGRAIMVVGRRAELAGPALRSGALLLAAPSQLCGDIAAVRRRTSGRTS